MAIERHAGVFINGVTSVFQDSSNNSSPSSG